MSKYWPLLLSVGLLVLLVASSCYIKSGIQAENNLGDTPIFQFVHLTQDITFEQMICGFLQKLFEWLNKLLECLNQLSGFLTAIATVAIAYFTWLLAEETKLTRLNQKMLERQGRDIAFLLHPQQQQLLREFSRVKDGFIDFFRIAESEKGQNFTWWHDQLTKIAEQAKVLFPTTANEIRSRIEELEKVVDDFSNSNELRNAQEFTTVQENNYVQLQSPILQKLDEVKIEIETHIQAQIDGKT